MENRLPEKLTALRKHLNYAQGDLAARLGVTVQEYMNWENGNSVPSIFLLKALADLYGVPLQDLADNARSVTLPRLDEDFDSVQIPFADLMNPDAQPGNINQTRMDIDQTMRFEENTPKADDTLEVTKTRDLRDAASADSGSFESTTVNRIVDDDSEEGEEAEEEEEVKEAPRKPKQAAAKKKQPAKMDQKRLYLLIAIAAAAVILIVMIVNMLGGRSSDTLSAGDTNRLALGNTFSIYVEDGGDVTKMGTSVPAIETGDLVQVSAGPTWAIGLKKDGTATCAGSSSACSVSKWTDLTMVAAGTSHSAAVKSDGTVICSGSDNACSVSDWTNISKVYAGNEFTIGMTTDKTLKVAGTLSVSSQLESLTKVQSVSISDSYILVLFSNGTVSCYSISGTAPDTSKWSGMTQVAAGNTFVAGLSGGKITVISDSDDSKISDSVKNFSGVKYIAARGNTLVALSSSGTIVGAGDNNYSVYTESSEAAPTPSAETEKLAQAANVQFSVTAANLTITWNAVQNADYYTVTVSTTPQTSVKAAKNSASISSDKLDNGTTYTITITSCSNNTDKYANSDALSVSYTYTANQIKLATPSAKAVQSSSNTDVTVSWDAVPNADSYTVQFQDYSNTVKDTSVTLSNMPVGTYTIQVIANPADGEKKYASSDAGSVSIEVKTITTPLGTTSLNSYAVNPDHSWTITWNAVSGAASYNVTINSVTHNTTTNSINWTDALSNGTSYSITVEAVPADTTKYSSSTSNLGNITYQYTDPTPTPTPAPTATPDSGSGGDGQNGSN